MESIPAWHEWEPAALEADRRPHRISDVGVYWKSPSLTKQWCMGGEAPFTHGLRGRPRRQTHGVAL